MKSVLAAVAVLAAGCATADSRADGGSPRSDAALLPDAGRTGADAGADAEPHGEAPPVLNEFVADDPSTDECEYVEVFGSPGADYGRYTVLSIEGDAGNDPGAVQAVIPVGTTSDAGLWVSGFMGGQLQNGSLTLLMVADFAGAPADIDGNDDGAIDSEPWSALVDAVAIDDGGTSDRTYAATAVLAQAFDGGTTRVAAASRIPDGSDSDQPADWVRNLDNAAGTPCESGTADAGEAQNTPGQPNAR
jgi:hypothetical protein